MKGFEKGLSPSKSNSKRNLSSSGLVENDENDLIVDELIPKFENHNISHGRNSTSGGSRNKILGESNESPSNSVDRDRKIEKYAGENAVSSEAKDGLSLKVYDPVLNFLSPRPQYLRFNPNRRRQIFKRLEEEMNASLDSEEAGDEEECSVEEIEDSSLSPQKGSAVHQRNGGIGGDGDEAKEEEEVKEIDEMTDSFLSPPEGNRRNGGQPEEDVADGYEVEGEDEGETEERGWCLRGTLKLLFTLIGCFLFTSYICTMHSPTDSPTRLAIWDFGNSGVVIRNETLGFSGTSLQDRGFCVVEDGGDDSSTEEEEVEDGSYEEFYEKELELELEAEILDYLELDEKEMVGREDEGGEAIVDEAAECDERMEAEVGEYLELDEKETDGNENGESEDDEVEYMEDVVRYMMVDVETDENLDGDMLLDSDIDNVKETAGNEDEESRDETEDVIRHMMVDAETDGVLDGGNVRNDSASETEIINYGAADSEALSSGTSVGSKGEDDTETLEANVGSYGGLSHSEWKTSTFAAVVSAVVVVSTSLAVVYHSKTSRRRSTSARVSEPVLKQTLAAEENVLPSIDRKVEFLPRPPLPSQFTREAASRTLAPHIHAPVVELIGEIIVGREPSSIRNSSNAITSEKLSLPRPVPTPSKPSAVEPSSTSFRSPTTTERNISRNEGGKTRESVADSTPVRRSSRLRNRPAVISP